MSAVIEFTMHANPGQYTHLLEVYSEFAEQLKESHEGLTQVLVVGDPGSGLVRGIGVFDSSGQAEAVNSEQVFADFNSKVTPLISGAPERVELNLVHTFTR